MFEARELQFLPLCSLQGLGLRSRRRSVVRRVRRCKFVFENGQGAGYLGANVLEEFRDNREGADTDTDGVLGVGPHAYPGYVVANIGRLEKRPDVVRS